MTQEGGEPAAVEPKAPARTIEDYQLFIADLHLRCTPREGFVSERVLLELDATDVASLDNLCRALSLMSPRAADIRKLLGGGGRR